jgi:hypothetical protein
MVAPVLGSKPMIQNMRAPIAAKKAAVTKKLKISFRLNMQKRIISPNTIFLKMSHKPPKSVPEEELLLTTGDCEGAGSSSTGFR